jgi:hypothetical protein
MFEIVVSGITPELASNLEEKFDAELRGMGERVEMRVKEKQVEAVLAEVLEARGRVMAVTPQRVSLESIFLDAVREEER